MLDVTQMFASSQTYPSSKDTGKELTPEAVLSGFCHEHPCVFENELKLPPGLLILQSSPQTKSYFLSLIYKQFCYSPLSCLISTWTEALSDTGKLLLCRGHWVHQPSPDSSQGVTSSVPSARTLLCHLLAVLSEVNHLTPSSFSFSSKSKNTITTRST